MPGNFGPPTFSPSARIGIAGHEPLEPVSGSHMGSGYSPHIMNLLGLNKKKPWTPGRAGTGGGASAGPMPTGVPMPTMLGKR